MKPSEYLYEAYMEPLNLTLHQLADALDVSFTEGAYFANGHKDIDAEMAVRLEYVFGRSAESWLSMQVNYNLKMAREKIIDKSLMKKLG